MKIVVLGTRGFPNVQGGVEAHCEHLYPCLADLSCEIIVLTRQPYVDPSVQEFKKVKLLSLSCPKQKFLEAIVHTFKGVLAAKRLKCDVLHIHAIGPALMVPLARLLGLKVVMTNHGQDYDRQKWGRLAKAILYLGEYLGSYFAHKVISISKPIADSLKSKYHCKAEIIPNGVVVRAALETREILKKFELEEKKYVLAVGRFVPEKGFHDLIKAFEIASGQNSGPRNDNLKLVIVGDADHENEYSRKLKRIADNGQRIVLTGRLTGQPLAEIYSHAGLFVLPSYHEGLPIVLLEAMSYGLSCVVSDIPANKEVTLDKGRYFKPGNINGLTTKLKEFIAQPLNLEEKHKQIEYIRENFDWEEIAKKTMKVYEKTISQTYIRHHHQKR